MRAAQLHESFTDGAILLLMGSLLIGVTVGTEGYKIMKPFTGDLFKGLLAFFLLEMGILVARRIREMQGVGSFLIAFAILILFESSYSASSSGLYK